MEETETIPIVESNQSDSHHEQTSGSFARNRIISDEELSRLIHSLNAKQRKVFNTVCDWTKRKLKSRTFNNRVDPLRLFITEGAGVGKSHLAKAISSYLIKNFSFHSGSPDKPKILLLAPTGVAAINIDGTTINAGLSINPNTPSFFGKSARSGKIKIAMWLFRS